MGYERYPRGDEPQRGSYGRDEMSDYGRDYRATEDRYTYSGARDYRASGMTGGGTGYGDDPQRGPGGWSDSRQDRFIGGEYRGAGQDGWLGNQNWQVGSGSGGQRAPERDSYRQARGTYERRPQAYRDDRGSGDDRGFLARAGDEVRSWFGDEDAERRREMDARHDQQGAHARDQHYHSWRNEQIAAFDRDYDEYRRENQSKFHNEFSSWRTERQGQRDLLGRVEEHATVVGSDGEHVGTVDKVRGDRIILTKSDADAGGHHHSVPSRWLQSAEGGTVTLRKTAAEAQAHWRDEERQREDRGAMFGRDDARPQDEGMVNLDRSFSGTY